MIPVVRVDNRLLHGQVLETWMPRLQVARVVVADDAAAASPLAQAAMTLCVPAEVPVEVLPLDRVDFAALAAAPGPVLVLVREVAGLVRAAAGGLTPARARRLNLGNVHFAEGRRPVSPSVFLSAAELAALEALAAAGFEVEARALPTDPPAGLAELARRYAAAR
ncbi:MAG: PTS sugar transporter subunit IIB [Anaeromyxobacter sp.]|nr:PTS sugar transporter subunit IIB [Anaeromyxobacter sp.]MBL0278155.1 PTS sugar transporter subunit IIB [Anaeromyxobacter sp.]